MISNCFRCAIFIALGLVEAFVTVERARATSDIEPPQLVSIDFTPKSIDVSTGAQTVTVTAHITDDNSGFSTGGAQFNSPSGTQYASVGFNGSNRSSGTVNDGVYQTTMTIPKSSEAGTWKMANVYVYDQVSNNRSYGPSNTPYPPGTPTDLVVTSTTADTAAPQLVSIDFNPKSIDVSTGSKTVTVTAHITDDNSGFSTGGAQFNSPSGTQYASVGFNGSNRSSGTVNDGVYQTTMTIPKSSEAGTWKMANVYVYDQVSNNRSYGPSNTPYPPGTPTDLVVSPPVQFSSATYSVSETASAIKVTVVRGGDSTGTISVHYATADGTAVAGKNYGATSGVLNFASGETSKDISIPIFDDQVYDGDQNFTVTLSAPTGAALAPPSVATVTISDSLAPPTVQLNAATYTVSESDGTVKITVTKSGPSSITASVHYATSDGTAIAGLSYTATSGDLTFAAGETTKDLVVGIIDDSVYRGDATFTFALSAPSGASLGTQSSGTVTIIDNDAPPTVQFSASSYRINSSAGTVAVTVTKTGTTAVSAAVHYQTTDGTAVAGSDYTATSGDLTFAPGETSKDIAIPLLNESFYEEDESFTVALTSPTAASLGGLSTTTVIINAHDARPSQPLNISTRADILGGDQVLIGGFIVVGADPKTVLVRAIGPSLRGAGVSGALGDPTLEMYDGGGHLIAANDNWQDQQKDQIAATGIAPVNPLESAVLITVNTTPGTAGRSNYTVVVKGKDNTTGVGLVEIYDLSLQANARLANISTRGFVGTNQDVLIGGFIVGGSVANPTKVIVRAIGPSLTERGVPNPLQDPTLALYDKDGNAIGVNDNWQDGQVTEINASGLAPTDPRESAVYAALLPGNYTAIVNGKNGATGVALVEAYNIP